jgi:hypothetical protein
MVLILRGRVAPTMSRFMIHQYLREQLLLVATTDVRWCSAMRRIKIPYISAAEQESDAG